MALTGHLLDISQRTVAQAAEAGFFCLNYSQKPKAVSS
jgi:hypothetical protein